MADRDPPGRLVRGVLCGLLGVAAIGQRAWADDASASTGTATGGATAAASGPASAGSLGPTRPSPSVLPATGVGAGGPDVRVGDLGAQFGLPLAGRAPEPAQRAWTITPSIGLTEQYATGGGGGGNGVASDQFITTLLPSVTISGDTTRLHGDLSYSPQIMFYSRDGNQNQIDQNFNGRLLATLVPQTLFLDLRGSGAVQAVTAGQAPDQLSTLARGNTTQSYSFSATPYAVHRFGPWGTGEIGGTYARTTQNALEPANNQTAFSQPLLAALADSSNQNVTTTSGHVAFTTGEAFSRYSGAALAQATNYAGSGVLDGAYRDIVTLDNGYGITRTITALGTIGWERIHYAGTSPVDIDDAIWNVGVRLEPNEGSSITVRYGHADGLNSLTVDAAYQPTARTRVYARYSTGLSTSAELLQNALATSDLDTQGNPIDHQTGAPLVATGNFFGVQNSLYKTELASLTGVLLFDRDSFSASVTSQTQTLVSASNLVGLANGNSRGTYGSFTWSHQIRPNLQSSLFAQYGIQSGGQTIANGTIPIPQSGDQRTLALSASLSYALTPTLSGTAQYSYSQTFGGQTFAGQDFGTGSGQSLFLVSLIKSF